MHHIRKYYSISSFQTIPEQEDIADDNEGQEVKNTYMTQEKRTYMTQDWNTNMTQERRTYMTIYASYSQVLQYFIFSDYS
jgi:hypothetical protein